MSQCTHSKENCGAVLRHGWRLSLAGAFALEKQLSGFSYFLFIYKGNHNNLCLLGNSSGHEESLAQKKKSTSPKQLDETFLESLRKEKFPYKMYSINIIMASHIDSINNISYYYFPNSDWLKAHA